MSKKLALQGHSTRGKEVIELLEMMGGEAIAAKGDDETAIYVIPVNGIIDALYAYKKRIDNYAIFTLEEFLEKYPFKVGDKVIDVADGCPGVVSEMKWDEDVSDMKYCVTFGNGIDFGWFANDSIEFCKENKNLDEIQSKRDIDKSHFIIKHMILPNKMDDKLEYEIIDGYKFDKVENNKIILKLIKAKFPKTYEECCQHLGCDDKIKMELIGQFIRLINARNAYWKIAGEQMGLGKPWEPDWTNLDQLKYCIWVDVGEFITMTNVRGQHILAFPTEEMRDAFYENFKELIEQCKKLL